MSDQTPIIDAPSKPPRRFRRTRIAVSVFFGVLIVAVLALWLRSYAQYDAVRGGYRSRLFGIDSFRGGLAFIAFDPRDPDVRVSRYELEGGSFLRQLDAEVRHDPTRYALRGRFC